MTHPRAAQYKVQLHWIAKSLALFLMLYCNISHVHIYEAGAVYSFFSRIEATMGAEIPEKKAVHGTSLDMCERPSCWSETGSLNQADKLLSCEENVLVGVLYVLYTQLRFIQ